MTDQMEIIFRRFKIFIQSMTKHIIEPKDPFI